MDKELEEYLTGVIGVVDATTAERHFLWREWHEGRKLSWVEPGMGHGLTIGRLADMPVFISLYTSTIDGHKILFLDPTSQVVDHRMIDEWLKENMPPSAWLPPFDQRRINRTDALNFSNIFPRAVRAA